MKNLKETGYREFLVRYAETARRRRPGFSLGAWAKSLGLRSTSSLTKVLNGDREAGVELVEKLVRYFKFSPQEENQFRALVAVSKIKGSANSSAVVESLLQSKTTSLIESRLIGWAQYELFSNTLHLAIRELTRLPKMKVARLVRILPNLTSAAAEKSLALLARLKLVARDAEGHFVASDESVHSPLEHASEAIRNYHRGNLQAAIACLESESLEDRDFQSLVFLLSSSKVPEIKKRLRDFIDSIENEFPPEEVDRLYQIQFQFFPVSKRFEMTSLNPLERKLK